MENNDLDLIKEKILSLEDFQNVDSELMQIISQNEEYQRLFSEYKEISLLAKESAPAPQKNGVSLHNAVMNRVKNGDVAPKYINTSKFRFPFATVASVFVVVVVVWLMKSGVLPQNNKNLSDISDINITSQKSTSQTEQFDESQSESGNNNCKTESNNAYFATFTAENEKAVAFDTADTAETAEESESETENSVAAYTAKQNQAADSANGSAKKQTLNESQTTQNGTQNSDLTELPREQTSSAQTATGGGAKAEVRKAAKNDSEQPNENTRNTEDCQNSEILQNNVEESHPQVFNNAEIPNLILLAEQLGATEKIDSQLISSLGEQKFVEWFQTISQSPNFKELYTEENFKNYCEENR